jgi:hypothetical protein
LGYGYWPHSYSRYYNYRPYGYYYNGYNSSSYSDDAYPDRSGEYSYDTTARQGKDLEDPYAQGWEFLREDRPAEALEAFSTFVQAYPAEGIPRVGHALASAELGRLDKGIRSMRGALRVDPEALHYLTVDAELQLKVEQLADRYERSPRLSGRNRGGSFMLAALYYLMDDMDAAQEAIERNTATYDTSASAKNLKWPIEGGTQTQ